MPDKDTLATLFAFHQQESEKYAKQLIIEELSEASPALQSANESAEKALAEAESALELPLAEIASVDEDIGRAQARLAEYSAQRDDRDIEVRVDARVKADLYSDELSKLQDKRRQMSEQMDAVFYAVRNKAASDLDLVKNARMGLAAGMMNPFGSAAAQGTESYISYRQPFINQVIIAGDENHPEWGLAVDIVKLLAQMAGLCADDFPTRAEMNGYQNFWDSVRANPEPVPSGAEVIGELHSAMENQVMQEYARKTKSVIEDYTRPHGNAVRDYMSAPHVATTARKM